MKRDELNDERRVFGADPLEDAFRARLERDLDGYLATALEDDFYFGRASDRRAALASRLPGATPRLLRSKRWIGMVASAAVVLLAVWVMRDPAPDISDSGDRPVASTDALRQGVDEDSDAWYQDVLTLVNWDENSGRTEAENLAALARLEQRCASRAGTLAFSCLPVSFVSSQANTGGNTAPTVSDNQHDAVLGDEENAGQDGPIASLFEPVNSVEDLSRFMALDPLYRAVGYFF